MGWYGTLLLAKPANGTLPAHPQVRPAFGSRFMTPGPWGNAVGLHDLGDGWQRVGVKPFYSERLRLAAGVQALVAATAAPVLAAWVSESVCAHVEGSTPGGVALSVHLPNTDEECGYEHLEGQPARVQPRLAVKAVEAWAREAGRTPSTEVISAIVDGLWNELPAMEDEVLALFAALGFPPETEILPVIDAEDPAFGDYGSTADWADMKASGLIHAASRGEVLGPEYDLTPKERDYLRFRDLVWGSVYGGGLSREELIARYEQLTSQWPDQ
ncbi:hypothetical protein [Micromonospora foliorum]|uniref:hypothetical protein n=1 Tax=Micromonospora foliorum TaxID=2911210 RepID=UPI001EE7A0A4|nr:hypothetical protein [Micromonospora foliorum]MCG5437678.1 hypothetical protein [Micromonospora foliorum]